MHMIDQFVDLAIRINETLCEFFRMRSRVTNALDTVNLRHIFQKRREVRDFTIGRFTPISVHVLSQKRDFFNSLGGKLGDFQ